MNILIVGGTGTISWRLSQAAIDARWQVTVLNRAAPDRKRRARPPGCNLVVADINNESDTERALGTKVYDAVVDFVCYNDRQAARAVSYFRKRSSHYVFISTTALYDRQVAKTPLTEGAPIITNGWDYALSKAGAERVFTEAMSQGLPGHDPAPGAYIRHDHSRSGGRRKLDQSLADVEWQASGAPWRWNNIVDRYPFIRLRASCRRVFEIRPPARRNISCHVGRNLHLAENNGRGWP